MTPLKNGVNVYLQDYGYVLRADVYSRGDIFIFRCNPHEVPLNELNEDIDYRISLSSTDAYWRDPTVRTIIVSFHKVICYSRS